MKNIINIMDEEYRKEGNSKEELMEDIEFIYSHTKIQKIDFLTSCILHYEKSDKDNMYFQKINPIKSDIWVDTKEGKMLKYSNDLLVVKKADISLTMVREIENNQQLHTAFLVTNPETYEEDIYFTSQVSNKTFPQRMPVKDIYSSLERDLLLAIKFNDTDSECGGFNGELYVVYVEFENTKKIIAYYAKKPSLTYKAIVDHIMGRQSEISYIITPSTLKVIEYPYFFNNKTMATEDKIHIRPFLMHTDSTTGHMAFSTSCGMDINNIIKTTFVEETKNKKQNVNVFLTKNEEKYIQITTTAIVKYRWINEKRRKKKVSFTSKEHCKKSLLPFINSLELNKIKQRTLLTLITKHWKEIETEQDIMNFCVKSLLEIYSDKDVIGSDFYRRQIKTAIGAILTNNPTFAA